MLAGGRVDWVDYAKGFCIVFVVMMHATLGVEKAAGEVGWMHAVIEFARPFRMPDFFLIAGLFLARVIDRDWTTYLDRKLVHFAYFYVLWVTIQFAFKAPFLAAEIGATGALSHYLIAFINPFGTLWFIYLLPVFFIVTKLTRGVPWWIVWSIAAFLQVLPIDVGWYVIDEFAERFVFFYTGYIFAERIFAFAEYAMARLGTALAILAVWGAVNGALVFNGLSDLPLISLLLGLFGAVAVVTISALLSKSDLMAPLRYFGEHSIVIYLAFFLPMVASRIVLMKLGIVGDIGTLAALVTAAGVVGPLALCWLVRGTAIKWLFERPSWAHLVPRRRFAVQPAE